jgi:uncharacterized protein (TIGR00299 family) protein
MNTDGRILFVDGSAGASGDMILGALVDLGVPVALLKRELAGLPIEKWTLRSRKVVRCGLAARKVDVRFSARATRDQHGRGLAALERIVKRGRLKPEVRDMSLAVFRRLIESEARVHGAPVDKVHLHEAGSADAVIDVVGACVGLHHLGIAHLQVSPLTTGFGSVECAHGSYPVPGPATLELVRGCPVQAGPIEAERLTPTGAAILTTLCDHWGELPAMRPLRTGYGSGDHDLGRTPNLLRMVLGQPVATAEAGALTGEVSVIECTIDDSTPEELAFACEQLLEAGALDVFTGPLTMKKGRAAHRLTILARPDRTLEMAECVMLHTSTFGLRFRSERRLELDRSSDSVPTPYGPIRMKVGRLGDWEIQASPEYEDCAAAARAHGVALREVQRAAVERHSTIARRKDRGSPRTRKPKGRT